MSERDAKLGAPISAPLSLHEGVDAELLVRYLCDQQWHQRCAIHPEYMPPFPGPDTRPKVAVSYLQSGHLRWLRYSHGPKQGFFWDIYGDDFQSRELAIIALSQAPSPVMTTGKTMGS